VRIDARDLGQQPIERQRRVQDRVPLVRPEPLRVQLVEPQREGSQADSQDVI
jgi:hypothetical protein